MAQAVDTYVEAVRRESIGKALLIEQSLRIDHLTGEADAVGTGDAVAVGDTVLDVHDLKYGQGVRVSAEANYQMMAYASAALREHGLVSNFERIRMFIHQPRLDNLDVWECTPADVAAFEDAAGESARQYGYALLAADLTPFLTPGEKQCRFCKAKATCPALAEKVVDTVGADFDALISDAPSVDIDALESAALSKKMFAADMIEGWVKAVRAEVERRLLAGTAIPGFKLVEGRRGARSWKDPTEVEKTLKAFRLKKDEMYDFKLISPSAAEKILSKDKPNWWAKLLALITQSDGKPSVAPASDKRKEWTPAGVDDFEIPTPDDKEGAA